MEAESTRLTIKTIVCENFKSYAGKQEIGPFHASFSAVVGPNGSGKSNLIDAMLFVFGKKAAKMRSKNLKELINASQLPAPTSCRVSVYLHTIYESGTPVPNSGRNWDAAAFLVLSFTNQVLSEHLFIISLHNF